MKEEINLPASYIYKRMIREEIKKLTKPVTLNVVTSSENLQKSIYMIETLDIYQKNSNGLITIKEHRLRSNSEFIEKYDIQRTPAILIINDQEQELIRYLAVPMGAEIQPFVQALMVLTGAPNYYKAMIKKNLEKINPSTIQAMITETCPYCPTILSICSQFALASEGKIRTIIVDIMAHPDIGDKYNISTVPYVVVNDKHPLIGNVGADEIIKLLINENL